MTKHIKADKIAGTIKEALALLKTTNLRFCVVGSVLCHHYLNDHARYTKDIDIIFEDEFVNIKDELIKVFGNIDFCQEDENELFYEPSFTAFTQINGERAQIEGKRINFFNEVETCIYEIDGVSFKGAKIEYVIAEKLVSLLCELARPFKHLVDIYSFTQIDQSLINHKEISRYINLINKQENEFRKRIGLEEYCFDWKISKNKSFTGPVITPTLQSKYNVNKEEMIDEINHWLSLWHTCGKHSDNI